MLMRDAEGRSKQCHIINKAKHHSTPKAATFPNKNDLRTHDTLYSKSRQSALPAELPRHMYTQFISMTVFQEYKTS